MIECKVCGYKKGNPYIEEEKNIGDKDFIEIQTDSKRGFSINVGSDYYSDGTRQVTIYACPVCGTLKINL